MKNILLLFVLSFLTLIAQAQTLVQVKGTVKDADTGEELIGASVWVVSTNTGVSTDFSGNFTVTVPLNSTLKVSYVGYQTQEIRATGTSNLDINLSFG